MNNLTASNMTELFGEVFSNGMPHIAPVEKSFKFGKSYGEVCSVTYLNFTANF